MSAVLQKADTVLSARELETYRDDGFLTMRRVLASELMQRLNDVTDRLREEARHLTARTKHFDLAKGHSAERPRVRRISSPTELDTIFREIAFDSILGDIAAELVGGAVKFYHSKLNFKSPEGGAEIGWHQDWPVFPHTNTNLLR